MLPEFREYERLSSTVVNAYLMPATRDYFRKFEAEVAHLAIPEPPFIMNSGGGIMTPEQAGERPIDTLFSGPSGGVSGAVWVARAAATPTSSRSIWAAPAPTCASVQNGKPQLVTAA